MSLVQLYECRLRAAEVLRLEDVANQTHVRCAEQLALVGHALTRELPHEQVWLVMLSAAHEIRGAVRLSEGGLHGCALCPGDVFRPVLVAACGAFALIHNHPSGDPRPSEADREMTRKIYDAGELLGVHLVDHVVVTSTPGRWHSMGARGDE